MAELRTTPFDQYFLGVEVRSTPFDQYFLGFGKIDQKVRTTPLWAVLFRGSTFFDPLFINFQNGRIAYHPVCLVFSGSWSKNTKSAERVAQRGAEKVEMVCFILGFTKDVAGVLPLVEMVHLPLDGLGRLWLLGLACLPVTTSATTWLCHDLAASETRCGFQCRAPWSVLDLYKNHSLALII